MKISYLKARKATIKGPFIYSSKSGHVSIPLGECAEVDEVLAHEIMGLYGDIIKKVDDDELDPDSLEKTNDVPENKMMPDPAVKKAEEEKAKKKAEADKAKAEAAAKVKAKKEATAAAKAQGATAKI